MTIRNKLITTFLLIGTVPALLVGALTWIATGQLANGYGTRLQYTSHDLLDKVERNLFERYGDVQAFGVNAVVQDQGNWYKPNGPIVDAMNNYAALYGIYDVLLLVDAQGKVIAVNSKSASGGAVDTQWLYKENFATAKWFSDSINGKFLSTDVLTGTVVEDAAHDPIVARSCPGGGASIGFSTPVKDASGKTIGVWKNFAKFDLVKEIVQDTYSHLKEQGMPNARITLVDRAGRSLLDVDPNQKQEGSSGTRSAELGMRVTTLTKESTETPGGWHPTTDEATGEPETAAFSKSEGALGYAGLQWSVLIQVPETDTHTHIASIHKQVAGVVIISSIAVVAAAIWYAARFLKPIKYLGGMIDEIATGDLRLRVDATSKDELGELSRRFNAFMDSLQEAMTDVSGCSREVASAATEIAASADEMAAGLSRQESQTAQVASAVEELSASVVEVAHKGKSAAESATASRDDAQQGGEIVANTVTEITGIANDVSSSVRVVSELGKQTDSIGEIIEVISSIADQTNLLALNAAIEAARAGVHGRGFAVVADEVRKLAERTASATDEVAQSIRLIQAQTRSAVQQIENGNARVTRGVQLATQAGQSLGRINQNSEGLAGLISSIAAAADQQGAASEQIARSIAEINSVCRESSGGASQASQAAALLSRQAEHLRSAVGRFQV